MLFRTRLLGWPGNVDAVRLQVLIPRGSPDFGRKKLLDLLMVIEVDIIQLLQRRRESFRPLVTLKQRQGEKAEGDDGK